MKKMIYLFIFCIFSLTACAGDRELTELEIECKKISRQIELQARQIMRKKTIEVLRLRYESKSSDEVAYKMPVIKHLESEINKLCEIISNQHIMNTTTHALSPDTLDKLTTMVNQMCQTQEKIALRRSRDIDSITDLIKAIYWTTIILGGITAGVKYYINR